MSKNLSIPKNGANIDLELNDGQSLIILGANGSGKTRLGARMDLTGPQKEIVHRISAQKSLVFPDGLSKITSIESAENDFLYGYSSGGFQHKIGSKYASKPATHLVNDYQKLLDLLFIDHNEEATRYREESKMSPGKISLRKTKLDLIKEIRDIVLPHRELVIHGNNIATRLPSGGEYSASEMSDGERVIFYLIGQCLCASENSIIIIDEPELHLNRSIQFTLWDQIERARKDCLFLYFTHDIDFATAKSNSLKIRLKSFDGATWDWEEYDDLEGVPEELQLEVIGTRQKVLFIEGDNNSYDINLYKNIFPNVLIKPCGGCQNVINYVRSFRSNVQFTGREFYGLIDRDRRMQSDIDNLSLSGIFTLEVAEIENIFIIPEILSLIAEMHSDNTDVKVSEITDSVVQYLSDERETQIALRMEEEIRHRLRIGVLKTSSPGEIVASYGSLVGGIDIDSIKISESEKIDNMIGSRDYKEIIKFYNRKDLPNRVAPILDLQKRSLQTLVVRSLENDLWRDKIISGIKGYIPQSLISLLKI